MNTNIMTSVIVNNRVLGHVTIQQVDATAQETPPFITTLTDATGNFIQSAYSFNLVDALNDARLFLADITGTTLNPTMPHEYAREYDGGKGR